MTKNRAVLMALTLLTLTFGGLAIAQTDSGTVSGDKAPLAEGVQSMTGLVVSFESDRLVVRTSEGEQTFLVLSNTTRPATLQANMPVVVHYVAESGGQRAVTIEENSRFNAADETPGGQVSGSEWPGAPNQDDNDTADSAGDASMDSTASTGTMDHSDHSAHSATGTMDETDTTASTSDHDSTATSGTAYGQSVGTTTTESGTAGSTGTSDTMADDSASSLANDDDTMADDTMASDDTMADDDQTAGTTGSTYDRGTSETDTMAATDDQSYAGDSLPETGSELPFVALIGLAALIAAAGLHFGRNA